jgi:hypothetical protein
VGFGEIPHFTHVLAKIERLEAPRGFSPFALLHEMGVAPGPARGVALVIGITAGVAALVVARRVDGDRRSFTLAVVACLLLSPIVWSHYFVLLLAPLALAVPRYSVIWLAPATLWATAELPATAAISIGLAAAIAIAVVAYRGAARGPSVAAAGA